MKEICLLIIILSTISCAKPDLNGHWHVKSKNEGELILGRHFLTLDIYNNTLGIINENVFLERNFDALVDFKKNEMLFQGECHVLDLKFKLNNKDLYLRQIHYTDSGEHQFVGKRCDEECCDKQKDHFSSTIYNFDLPQIIDTIGLSSILNIPRNLIYPLIFGFENEPSNKKNNQFKFTTGLKDFEIKVDEIEIHEEKFQIKIQEQIKKYLKRVILADKEISLKEMYPVIKKYSELGINKMYIGLRQSSKNKEVIIWIKQIELSKIIDEKNQEITWDEFVKKQ